ncbi:Hsp20/alpha crystallin family protein [Patulibacter brassicae]|uniref:Hsp20/alpha crystallin family protein n=1 Tax=Patulibacter brassicae TaxID=1705717 RepID=A0ABU4VRP3_9ACTN|nr:Hsp20/alpha crystallin family protein [Patulibacter brassicae]MDX8153470.1 Hsp20/alpha crystallin family protein [Patulibacter brassicae]
MTIVRWDPSRELSALQQQVNQAFSSFFEPGAAPTATTARWIPPIDLVEREGEYVLVADLPGVAQDAVTIEVERDVLTLAGRREIHHDAPRGGVVRSERVAGSFRRQLTLPEGVDADAIEARFADGVLEVRIPKPEAAKPRRVEIRIGRDETPAIDAPVDEREPALAGG